MRTILAAFAKTVALLLIASCGAPPRVDVLAWDAEFARLDNTAQAAFDRGSLTTACTLYEQALTHARSIDAALEIGNSAYNLAVCRMALGQDEGSRALLRESEAELHRAQANLADVLLVAAKLAWRQGRREDARRYAKQVLSHPASAPTGEHRAEVALLEGQMACEDGNVTRAKAGLEELTRQPAAISDLRRQIGTEKLAGWIHLLENEPEEAARSFDREAAFCREARRVREVAGALVRSGEAWQLAGQPAVAAERLFRAARSLFAQGRDEESLKYAELSLTLAAETHDEALQQRVLELKSALQSSATTP